MSAVDRFLIAAAAVMALANLVTPEPGHPLDGSDLRVETLRIAGPQEPIVWDSAGLVLRSPSGIAALSQLGLMLGSDDHAVHASALELMVRSGRHSGTLGASGVSAHAAGGYVSFSSLGLDATRYPHYATVRPGRVSMDNLKEGARAGVSLLATGMSVTTKIGQGWLMTPRIGSVKNSPDRSLDLLLWPGQPDNLR